MGSAILVGSAYTLGVPAEPVKGGTSLDVAKAESGLTGTPDASVSTPAGRLRIVNPELVAATFGQRIRFELSVDRAVSDGTVEVGIPARWRTRTVSGLVPSRMPKATRAASGVRLDTASGAAMLRLADAQPGATTTFEVTDTGIPAGTYHLPVTWTDSAGSRSLGSLELRLYAPVREERVPLNVSNDLFFESETFVTVVPTNANRVLVGSNGGPLSTYNAWFSTDGGATFARRALSPTMDVPGTALSQLGNLCCDPFSMADDQGNIWYGGLTLNGDDPNTVPIETGPSRIVVGRIAAGTDTFGNSVGLPRRTNGTQDKPMGAIDNDPLSPRYGRLYVVWGEPIGGGVRIVLSQCDTRPNPEACDDADSWSSPVTVSGAIGGYIYAEVAAAPDGTVYVIWWDYSATNAVVGDTCGPAETCTSTAAWDNPTAIALLQQGPLGEPVPFICPILAQPGGRAAPATAIDVDRNSNPLSATRGTVYVTWSDLRPGSGTTRCAEDPFTGDGIPPESTHLNFDSFVATALNALPGGAVPSENAGARLVTDALGAATSDDWFASVAVDQSTGKAFANVYSTRDDPGRFSTHLYAHEVFPNETLGPLVRVSRTPSDYSNEECCEFGNDYGDYTGIDAAGGNVFLPWSEKTINEDGEAFFEKLLDDQFDVTGVALVDFGEWTADEGAPSDGDGVFEPGEVVDVNVPLTNRGPATAPQTQGVLSTTTVNVGLLTGTQQYGDIAAGQTKDPPEPYRVQLQSSLPCGQPVLLTLDVSHHNGALSESRTLVTGCNAAPPPPPAPPQPPPPPPGEPAPPPPPVRTVCVVPRVVGLKLPAARTRISRARYCRLGRITRRKVTRRTKIGRVLAQTPRAGLRRPRGTRINLVVGRR